MYVVKRERKKTKELDITYGRNKITQQQTITKDSKQTGQFHDWVLVTSHADIFCDSVGR